LGAKNSLERARQDEMDRLGITQEMLDAAQDIGLALERSMDGLDASKDSLGTLQRLARKLDADAEQVYDKAKAALADNNEEQAKEYLLQRTTIQDKLKNVLLQCAEEKKRYEQMESNVSALEERAMEVNSLLKRAVGAKTIAEADAMGLALQSEDPLLQKFRDAGID
jgi:phage shock protein A